MLIALYGINNIGKSTQAKILVEKLEREGYEVEFIKYPIYSLAPTGPKLNEILRSGKKQTISEEALQELYAENRHQFDPQLREILKKGIIVVAEDYIGTGLAWGMAKGVALKKLIPMNEGLVHEDLAILMDGKRFLESKEANHLHESDDTLMMRCRTIHRELASSYHWSIIQAFQPHEFVAQDIWNVVEPNLPPRSRQH